MLRLWFWNETDLNVNLKINSEHYQLGACEGFVAVIRDASLMTGLHRAAVREHWLFSQNPLR